MIEECKRLATKGGTPLASVVLANDSQVWMQCRNSGQMVSTDVGNGAQGNEMMKTKSQTPQTLIQTPQQPAIQPFPYNSNTRCTSPYATMAQAQTHRARQTFTVVDMLEERARSNSAHRIGTVTATPQITNTPVYLNTTTTTVTSNNNNNNNETATITALQQQVAQIQQLLNQVLDQKMQTNDKNVSGNENVSGNANVSGSGNNTLPQQNGNTSSTLVAPVTTTTGTGTNTPATAFNTNIATAAPAARVFTFNDGTKMVGGQQMTPLQMNALRRRMEDATLLDYNDAELKRLNEPDAGPAIAYITRLVGNCRRERKNTDVKCPEFGISKMQNENIMKHWEQIVYQIQMQMRTEQEILHHLVMHVFTPTIKRNVMAALSKNGWHRTLGNVLAAALILFGTRDEFDRSVAAFQAMTRKDFAIYWKLTPMMRKIGSD